MGGLSSRIPPPPPASIEKFSLNRQCCWGYIHRILDGDTVEISIYIPLNLFRPGSSQFGWYRIIARLARIDSAEKSDPRGPIATRVLTELCKQVRERVYVSCGTPDKYGRLLVSLYPNQKMGESFNDILVNHRDPKYGSVAWSYDGKKKNIPPIQL